MDKVVIRDFTNIIAWQKSHELTLRVYRMTESFPKQELFGLVSQMRRCAVSVPSNIVEGFRRKTRADCLHFYTIALGSLEELKYQLLLAKDLRYITNTEYDAASEAAAEVGKLINAWKKVQK